MARSNTGISGFARVARNLTKMGYYPTKEEDAKLIATWFTGSNYLMLDPCCGEGKALHTIMEARNNDRDGASSFGIEIERNRAEQARKLGIGPVVNEDFLSIIIERGSVGAVFLNPPYDTVDQTHYHFIEQSTDLLCAGGLLILIIPQYELKGKTAVFLESIYENIMIFRSIDTTFKQLIMLGVKKEKRQVSDVAAIAALAVNPPVIREYVEDYGSSWNTRFGIGKKKTPSDVKFNIPRTKSLEDIKISWKGIDPVVLEEKLGLFTTDWDRLKTFIPEAVCVKRPILPLRRGHLAQILASGLTDGVITDPATGKMYLIKGTVSRITEVVEEDEEKTTEVTHDVVSILKMDTNGNLREIK